MGACGCVFCPVTHSLTSSPHSLTATRASQVEEAAAAVSGVAKTNEKAMHFNGARLLGGTATHICIPTSLTTMYMFEALLRKRAPVLSAAEEHTCVCVSTCMYVRETHQQALSGRVGGAAVRSR